MTYAIIAYLATLAIWLGWLLLIRARERSLRDD